MHRLTCKATTPRALVLAEIDTQSQELYAQETLIRSKIYNTISKNSALVEMDRARNAEQARVNAETEEAKKKNLELKELARRKTDLTKFREIVLFAKPSELRSMLERLRMGR